MAQHVSPPFGAHFAASLPITLEGSGIRLVLYQLHDVHSDILHGVS